MLHVTTYASWSSSRLLAILIVGGAMALLLGFSARRRSGSGGLLNGVDNRWSTSKVSVFLWTAAVLWAFVTVLLRFHATAVPSAVPAEYLAVLGIPAVGALGAKAITSGQAVTKSGLTAATKNPITGLGQVLSDDAGAPDLLDSQYFLFNLVLLGYFVAGFFHITDPVAPSADIVLPALPASLLALSGVSTASYLGKKHLTGGTGAGVQGSANGGAKNVAARVKARSL